MKKYFTFLTLLCLSVFTFAQNIEDKLVDRLKEYAEVYTCSSYDSDEFPSTDTQRVLAALLAEELVSFGIPEEDVKVDDNSYVYATIKGNVENAPTVFLSAHLDTTPDAEFNTKAPEVKIHNYNGGNLVINQELGIVLTEQSNEFLHDAIGGKVITSDGETLLGGDDRAGMAIVMTLAETFTKNPNIPHGDIRIIFTPDEEIGNSTKYLTKENIKADFGLVLDSHGFGRIVVENFNAADFSFYAKGISGFPGRNPLPTPLDIVLNFAANFPQEKAAYKSSGMEGYISLHSVKDVDDGVMVRGRLRSFDLGEMAEYKDLVQQLADKTAQKAINDYITAKEENPDYRDIKDLKYVTVINGVASGTYEKSDPVVILTMNDSYFNAKEILNKYPTNYNLIVKAYEIAGVRMYPESSRGGSDACDITYMGVPTYNIFTGSHNEHSRDEWVSSKQMLSSYNVAYNYLTLMAQQNRKDLLKEKDPEIKITPIKALDFFIKNIYEKISNKYGDTISNF